MRRLVILIGAATLCVGIWMVTSVSMALLEGKQGIDLVIIGYAISVTVVGAGVVEIRLGVISTSNRGDNK